MTVKSYDCTEVQCEPMGLHRLLRGTGMTQNSCIILSTPQHRWQLTEGATLELSAQFAGRSTGLRISSPQLDCSESPPQTVNCIYEMGKGLGGSSKFQFYQTWSIYLSPGAYACRECSNPEKAATHQQGSYQETPHPRTHP